MNTHSKRRYNVLSAAFVSKVTAPGHYHDGHGLILRVTRAGTKQIPRGSGAHCLAGVGPSRNPAVRCAECGIPVPWWRRRLCETCAL